MNVLHENLMYPNKTWNQQGPKLPRWFREGLSAIDRNLVNQFLPPRPVGSTSDEGVDCQVFPGGVWVVAKRLPRSRMLCKRWVAVLGVPRCAYSPPNRRDLKLIKRARNLWRNGRLDEMTRALDRTISMFYEDRDVASRKILSNRIVQDCRDLSLTKRSMGIPIVSMHQPGKG